MLQDLDQDIRDHIERETEDNIGRGMSPEEARYAALRKFGNVTRIREETREAWTVVWLEELWQDISFGLRMLVKSPALTVIVAMTLALGR
jgi:putative ABC transport system permease protein